MKNRGIAIRNFREGDEESFLHIVNAAYRNLETLTPERVKRPTSPPYFDAQGFFIAENRGQPIGCVGVFNLPAEKYVEIRYLAVIDALSETATVDSLIDAALKFSASKRPELTKAVHSDDSTLRQRIHTVRLQTG